MTLPIAPLRCLADPPSAVTRPPLSPCEVRPTLVGGPRTLTPRHITASHNHHFCGPGVHRARMGTHAYPATASTDS